MVLDSSDIEVFGALVDNFEWATESGDHKVVEEEINVFLMALDPAITSKDARIQYTNLFTFVLKLLSGKGRKELSAPLLVRELGPRRPVTFEDRLPRREAEAVDRNDQYDACRACCEPRRSLQSH